MVNEAHGFQRTGVAQGGRHGAFLGTHFTTDLVAVGKDVFGAVMSERIDATIAGDLLGPVAPKDNLFLQVEHAHADLEAIENVAASFGTLEGRHGCARMMLGCLSAKKTLP